MTPDTYGEDRVACVYMVDTYRARRRDPRGRQGPGPARGRDRRDRQVVPAHLGAGDIRAAWSTCRSCRDCAWTPAHLGCSSTWPSGSTGSPPPRAAPVRRSAVRRGDLRDLVPLERSPPGFRDGPGRQGRRRGARAAQARRARGADAVVDVATRSTRSRACAARRSTSRRSPYADPKTYELIQASRTLGCFQIESPGQRELLGKFQPEHGGATSSSTSRCSARGR